MGIWKIMIFQKFSRKTLKIFQCELLRKWPLSSYLFTLALVLVAREFLHSFGFIKRLLKTLSFFPSGRARTSYSSLLQSWWRHRIMWRQTWRQCASIATIAKREYGTTNHLCRTCRQSRLPTLIWTAPSSEELTSRANVSASVRVWTTRENVGRWILTGRNVGCWRRIDFQIMVSWWRGLGGFISLLL